MEVLFYFLLGLFSVILLLVVSYFLRKLIWFFSPVFFLSNYIQWILYNPTRFLFKDLNSDFARWLAGFLNISFIAPVYWLLIHILMTPLRLINSLYFDVVLYWSVMLDDTLSEVFYPALGSYRFEKGWKYFFHWLFAFPWRFSIFLSRSFLVIADSFLMFGVSIILPTLTMYHGTRFENCLTDIAQKGRWLVGSGDYAGSGIYFAIRRKVATHYASSGESKGVLITRVTPTFTKNQATFSRETRGLIGNNGKELSRRLKFPFYTIEHWRDSMGGWWEYCLVQPNKAGTYISTWRIRPVAVLRSEGDKISRIWGGLSHYSLRFSSWFVGVVSWFSVLALSVLFLKS